MLEFARTEAPDGTQRQRGWSGASVSALAFLGLCLTVGIGQALLGEPPMQIDRGCLGGCAPGERGHWLGTDGLGRDVWRQLAGGVLTALGGGVVAAVASLGIGYALGAGAAAASWRGRRLPWWWWGLVLLVAISAVAWWAYRDAGVGFWRTPLPYACGALILGTLLRTHGTGPVGGEANIARWTAWGPRADSVLLAVTEVVSSVPALLLLLALAAMSLRPSLLQLIIIFVSVRWTGFAVQALQEVRAVLGEPYVEAARAGGVGTWGLLSRHVLPNAIPPLLVKAVLAVGGFIVVEGSFAFLGLGLPAEQPSWGRLLAQATSVRGGWWLWVLPGIPLIGSVLSLQVLARGWLRSAR